MSKEVQKTVTLEKRAGLDSYIVVRTRNTLEPPVRATLSKAEAQALIDQGVEVVVNSK